MTENRLKDIVRLAELQYCDYEIAVMLEMTEEEMTELYQKGSEANRAYKTGLMTMEAKVRQSIFTLANAGSSPAQAMAQKIIEERKVGEND